MRLTSQARNALVSSPHSRSYILIFKNYKSLNFRPVQIKWEAYILVSRI